MPFVFDDTSANIAGYTSAQIEQARISSPDLVGIPILSLPSDNEILEFPITGGGSIPEGTADKKVGILKESLSARAEPDNSLVRHEAVILAAKYPGDHTIDQIISIYGYLKNGDNSKNGWSYVPDPRGIDYFMYANETLEIGKNVGCVGAGDCDDFAILMSALVESVGGTTRIILAHNNSAGGHAYAEVYLGQLNAQNSQVEGIINWLKQKFNTNKIYTHIDTDTKDVWLNLDWGEDEKGNSHPGGTFYQGDKHIVLCIRDAYKKTPLNVPVRSNEPPKLISLTSDKLNPQYTGTAITWTAEAKDPDGDRIFYKFFLNGWPVTDWTTDNVWATCVSREYVCENRTSPNEGDNQVEVRIIDDKHAAEDGFDDSKIESFIVNAPVPVPVTVAEAEKYTAISNESTSSIAIAPNLNYIWSVSGIESNQITMVLDQDGQDLFGQAKYEPDSGPAWNAEVVGTIFGDNVDLTLTSQKENEMTTTKMSGTYANEGIIGNYTQVSGGRMIGKGSFSAMWINPDTSSYTPAALSNADQSERNSEIFGNKSRTS